MIIGSQSFVTLERGIIIWVFLVLAAVRVQSFSAHSVKAGMYPQLNQQAAASRSIFVIIVENSLQ